MLCPDELLDLQLPPEGLRYFELESDMYCDLLILIAGYVDGWSKYVAFDTFLLCGAGDKYDALSRRDSQLYALATMRFGPTSELIVCEIVSAMYCGILILKTGCVDDWCKYMVFDDFWLCGDGDGYDTLCRRNGRNLTLDSQLYDLATLFSGTTDVLLVCSLHCVILILMIGYADEWCTHMPFDELLLCGDGEGYDVLYRQYLLFDLQLFAISITYFGTATEMIAIALYRVLLILMFGDGYVSRTYMTWDEEVLTRGYNALPQRDNMSNLRLPPEGLRYFELDSEMYCALLILMTGYVDDWSKYIAFDEFLLYGDGDIYDVLCHRNQTLESQLYALATMRFGRTAVLIACGVRAVYCAILILKSGYVDDSCKFMAFDDFLLCGDGDGYDVLYRRYLLLDLQLVAKLMTYFGTATEMTAIALYCVLLIVIVGDGYASRTSMTLDEVLLDREVYNALPRRDKLLDLQLPPEGLSYFEIDSDMYCALLILITGYVDGWNKCMVSVEVLLCGDGDGYDDNLLDLQWPPEGLRYFELDYDILHQAQYCPLPNISSFPRWAQPINSYSKEHDTLEVSPLHADADFIDMNLEETSHLIASDGSLLLYETRKTHTKKFITNA